MAFGAIAGGLLQGASSGLGFLSQRKSQKFTERMMKNRWQWQMKDLRAAGLNPILGYANAPPVGGSPVVGPGGAGSIVSSAIAARKVAAELKILEAQGVLIGEQSEKVKAERLNIMTDPKKKLFRTLLDPETRGKAFKRLKLEVDRGASGQIQKFMSDAWRSTAKRFNWSQVQRFSPKRRE